MSPNLRREGSTTFQTGNAFYNAESEMARDLGVLVGSMYRSQTQQLRVLDVMAGSGVRSLRYVLEAGADWVWANDANPDVQAVLADNLSTLPIARYQLTHQEANRVLLERYCQNDFYDLVDLDCFGSPVPYLSACLGAVKVGGLLYLTSTDGRTVTGHAPRNCLSDYGGYTRAHPASHEQGLRLLIGTVQQLAASRGFGVEPIFSFFKGQIYRVMLRLVTRTLITPENYGYSGFCRHCGNYTSIEWRKLAHTLCPHDDRFLAASGPLWLGELHNAEYLDACIELAMQWGWKKQTKLLTLMRSELEMPAFFYPLGEIGRRGQLDIPKRSFLNQTLESWGYRVSSTHIHPEAIKTNATMQVCVEAAQSFG